MTSPARPTPDSSPGRSPQPQLADVDVTVVGAGIVGAAIARLLAGTQLSVALVEARNDVGDGTSKANTAILHTGFDATPGTLESRLVARGHELLGAYATETGIPVERTGALLVAWDREQHDTLPDLALKARRNGYEHCALVDADEVYDRVPQLALGAFGGLTVPDESVICTWTTNLALATDAVQRGTLLLLDCAVTSARTNRPEGGSNRTTLGTSRGEIHTRWVVNAAGLGAGDVDRLFGHDRVSVVPRRGELFVFDKLARPRVPHIVLPVPTSKGKGVLVSPTIYGNVMLGPTADDVEDPRATDTTEEGLDYLWGKGHELMPALMDEEVTATYAGLRAGIGTGDYLIDIAKDQHYVLLAGIRSTGLTAGMAIAEHVAEQLAKCGLEVEERPDLPPPPTMPNLGEAGTRPYQDPDLIAADPEYGRVVCFCERVTAGEIRDAMSSTIPPRDTEGLRRRTRALNGRCQGFFCGAAVDALIGGSSLDQDAL